MDVWRYLCTTACIFVATLLKVCAWNEIRCLQENFAAQDFRSSPGGYVSGEVSPSICESLCNMENFTYAAIMSSAYCLCGYSDSDLEDSGQACDVPCTVDSASVCGSTGSKALVVVDVEYLELRNVTLNVALELDGGSPVVVRYQVAVDADVRSLSTTLYFGDGTSVTFGETSMEITRYMTVPGLYTARVAAVDAETLQVVDDEVSFEVPDTSPDFEFTCPDIVKTNNTFLCELTVWRGTNLVANFGDYSESYAIPDGSVMAYGIPVPEHDEPGQYSSGCSEEAIIHHHMMTSGTAVGLEFLSLKEGEVSVVLLRPKCEASATFCHSCRQECPDPGVVDCSEEEDQAFSSYSMTCVGDNELPPTGQYDLEEIHTFPVYANEPGYQFVDLKEERFDVRPGDRLAFRSNNGVMVACRNASGVEAGNLFTDKTLSGENLDVRHFVRVLTTSPFPVFLQHVFSERGNQSVVMRVTTEDLEDYEYSRTVHVLSEAPISAVTATSPTDCLLVNSTVEVAVEVANGTGVSVVLHCDNGEVRESFLADSAESPVRRSLTCFSQGNFTAVVNASNVWSSATDSATFCCLNPISRMWDISTNSPQIASHGKINLSLEFSAESEMFPGGAVADIEFGDQSTAWTGPVSSVKPGLFVQHEYADSGIYTIVLNISNDVDGETFTTEVELFEKLGSLEVEITYSYNGEEEDWKPPQGASKTDVPVNATVKFTCTINGTVHEYFMMDNNSTLNSSENIFFREFQQAGERNLAFKARNTLEESDEVPVVLRVLAPTVNLQLTASADFVEPYTEVEFNLTFDFTDPFTCLIFDPGDGSTKQAFHNLATCQTFLEEDDIQRNTDTEYLDTFQISLKHSYYYSGSYAAKATAFNSIFRTEDSAVLQVSHPPSTIWIENNSTNINHPMKKFREENFRLETTAFLTENERYVYNLVWTVHRIDEKGLFRGDVDVSAIISHNMSALRFPSRFLDIGLYKVMYSIYIFDKEMLAEGNDTAVDVPSCFTYLEIMTSPLKPLVIKGGASYVLRGIGQTVSLEPGIYSEDPNDPDDKNFRVKWTCRRLNMDKLGEDYENDMSNSVINQNVFDAAEEKSGCFKGKNVLKGKQVELDTSTLSATPGLYHISATIAKDTRTARNWILINTVDGNPPGIIIMCEKSVACSIREGGFIISRSNFLALRAECVTECGDKDLTYVWDVYGVSLPSYDRIDLEGWTDHVIVDQDRLGINHTMFSTFSDVKYFHVKVSGTASDSRPEGVAKLYLYINEPPQSGRCELSALQGTAVTEVFEMKFTDWFDPEGHRIVDYSIYIRYSGYLYHIHYGEKKEALFVVPAGEIEVICSVTDFLGSRTKLVAGKISAVAPPPEELDQWMTSVNYYFIIAEGRMPLMTQAMAFSSIVEEEQQRENYEPISEEVNRIWSSYLSLPGIDSSYYTIQAVEEIEAEVRDTRDDQKVADAKKNEEMFEIVSLLPFEVLEDTEVYGTAVSALAECRPLNKRSKEMLNDMLMDMFHSSLSRKVPHPVDRTVANTLISNSMNSFVNTISEEMIGDHFLADELNTAFEFLRNNATVPNFFIHYIKGNRSEVERNVYAAKANEVKQAGKSEAMSQVSNMENISRTMVESITQDLMVNEEPFTITSSSGFTMEIKKRSAESLSGGTVGDDGFVVHLPGACVLLSSPEPCDPGEAISVTALKFTGIANFAGAEKVAISADSGTVDTTLYNRVGNDTLDLKNTAEPFEICLPLRPPAFDEDPRKETGLQFVSPEFTTNDDFMVYHKLELDSTEVTVMIDIMLDNNETPIVLLYAFGFKPSLLVFDGIKLLRDVPNTDGVHTLLVDARDHEVQPGDDFNLGVGHLDNSFAQNFDYSKNLTRNDMTSQFSSNYSISLHTTGCYFFVKETSSWSSEGCTVKSADSSKVCCLCNHLTAFGSGFIVAPNQIDFSYVFANAGFDKNLTIYLTLILTFCVYLLLVIWARWKDRKDIEKLGAAPLPDNDPQDKYLYEILVQTGYQFNAGTKSKVSFIVSGEDEETDVRTFTDTERSIFKRGTVDLFLMAVPRCLGQLNYLRVWHDNSGKGKDASWYLKHVVFKDVQTGLKYEFIANRWFAVEEGDGQIDHLLPVAGREQTSEFSHQFSIVSCQGIVDDHLWFSVFLRPARSRFTRVQRLSCCLAVLYLSMLASAMWYERAPEMPSNTAFKFGPFSLTPEQISIGLMTNLIVFPPSFLMVFIFRKSRPRVLRTSHINEALQKQYARWYSEYGQSRKNPSSNYVGKEPGASRNDAEAQFAYPARRKRFTLPWWCVIFGWLLVVASIASSMFFLWAYGLQFGDEKTSRWLTSLVISFFSSVLLTEPIKVFLLAMLMSCLCGNPELDDDDAIEDEEDPYLKSDEKWLHDMPAPVQVRRPRYHPMDPEVLKNARKTREKELKMYAVIKETLAYIVYLWILMVLSFGNRDPNSFFLRETLINNFIKPGDLWNDFNTVNNEVRFWNWTRNALIPELFPGLWYNGRIPLGLRLYTDDRNNFRIGYAVMRQIRSKPASCPVHEAIGHVVSECSGFASVFNEDSSVYKTLWNPNVTMNSKVPNEYKYLTAGELEGYPFWGMLDWYSGGGYVVPLVANRYEDCSRLVDFLVDLEKTGWIDKGTRSVFVEFGTYNAQVNLFAVVTIIAEFLPGGGIVPYYHISPIKLLHYHTGSGLLQLLCQVGFLIFTVFYTVSLLISSCKQGRKYFREYWNIAEFLNVAAAYAAIFVEVYKLVVTQRILHIFAATEGTGYIKLQEALLLDEAFCYLIGFLMSLATLKFLKLLRFNKRIGSMSSTLALCAKELKGYGVCLMVVFLAFVLLFWLTLGRAVREFCSFASAFESSISMMLKKFDYDAMEKASPIIAPFAFFTFALTASVVLVNILLTIIIQSFEEVKLNEALQSDDYKLIEFMLNRLKSFLGIGRKRIHAFAKPAVTKASKKNDAVSAFPAKVDRLVEFINSVYFDEEIDFAHKEFLKKFSSSDLATADGTAEPKEKKKKALPCRIPEYQSHQMKNYLDF